MLPLGKPGPKYKFYFCLQCGGPHVDTEPIYYSHIYLQSKQGGIQEINGPELAALREAAAIRRYSEREQKK